MAKTRSKKQSQEVPQVVAPVAYSLWSRAFFTLVPLIVLLMGRHIAVPGVAPEAINPQGVDAGNTSIFTLGVTPFISAAFLVEVAALIVPSWRELRHGGEVGRAKLQRATNILFIALAVFQAYANANFVQARLVLADRPMLSVETTMITWVAGAVVLKFIADFISARGLVNGYGAMVGAWCLIDIGSDVLARQTMLTPLALAILVGKIVTLVVLTFFILERFRDRNSPALASASPHIADKPTDADNPYAGPADTLTSPASTDKQFERKVQLPSPVSGIVPYSTVMSLMALPASLAVVPGMQKLADTLERPMERNLVTISLLFALTLLFGWLFQQPRRVAALYACADESKDARGQYQAEAQDAFQHGSAIALFYMLAFLAIDLVVRKYVPDVSSTGAIAVTAAVVFDVVAGWRIFAKHRDLVPIWPEHRPYAIAAIRDVLQRAGIVVHVRDERQRRLLQFTGPHVPMYICVPVADAERARKLLEEVFLEKLAADATSDPVVPIAAMSGNRRQTSRVLTVGIVVLVFVVLSSALPTRREEKVDRMRTTKLEFVLTDDEHSIVDQAVDFALEERLRVRLESEEVAVGPGKTVTRKYAVVQVAEGETVDAARLRLEEWLASFKVPAGTRAAIGEYQRYDPDRGHFYVAGWRTYLLKGSAILTEKDVYEAQAMPDANSPGHWLVRLVFTSDAGARFEQVTGENIKRRFAILLDGRVTSAPVIQSKIPGGVATITMGSRDPEREREDAQNLEKALNGH